MSSSCCFCCYCLTYLLLIVVLKLIFVLIIVAFILILINKKINFFLFFFNKKKIHSLFQKMNKLLTMSLVLQMKLLIKTYWAWKRIKPTSQSIQIHHIKWNQIMCSQLTILNMKLLDDKTTYFYVSI